MSFALKFGCVFEFFLALHLVFPLLISRLAPWSRTALTDDIPTDFVLLPQQPSPTSAFCCKGQQLVVTQKNAAIGQIENRNLAIATPQALTAHFLNSTESRNSHAH